MNRYSKRLIITITAIAILLTAVSCGSFSAGVPDSFVGRWKCEELASDGETDTSFYEMNIDTDGSFSIYDAAAGNPGISGKMGNDTGATIDCRFNMDDFDVPFCWDIDSSEATLEYEIEQDTLLLGHNGVWMTFHLYDEIMYENIHVPEAIDDLITIDLPEGYEKDMEYPYGGEDGMPIVERSFNNEQMGYFTARILSYKGYDCLGDITGKIDINEYIDSLDKMQEVSVGGETGFSGTTESDDMPDMIAVVYVAHGDYVFEFRISNYDERVTEKQIESFRKIVGSVEFTDQ